MRFILATASVSLATLLAPACTPNEPVTMGAACSQSQKIEACTATDVAVCANGTWQLKTKCASPCQRRSIGHGSTVPLCGEAWPKK